MTIKSWDMHDTTIDDYLLPARLALAEWGGEFKVIKANGRKWIKIGQVSAAARAMCDEHLKATMRG